jgi:hypothetical protein
LDWTHGEDHPGYWVCLAVHSYIRNLTDNNLLSVNCRLPQTPRSPSVAAAHYFDDTFSRQRRASLGPRRPTSLARSLTRTRSIGARSDWGSTTGGESTRANTDNGEDDDEDGDDEDGGKPHPEDDPDDPINRYVQDQLARIKSHESAEMAEELAAQNDGANDEL